MTLHVSYSLNDPCTVKIKRDDYTVVDMRYQIPRREAEAWAEKRLAELEKQKEQI